MNANRLIGAVLCAAMLAPLLVATRLTPAGEGLGTHEQLGLPRCGFHAVTGLPCATCGMTTTFTYATHGQMIRAFINQPAGMVICLACAVLALVSGWAAISGMSLRPVGNLFGRPRLLFGGLGFLLLSWMYNIWVHLG